MALKLKRNKSGRHILIVLAALAATIAADPAKALPADLPALPSFAERLYNAGNYRQAADALQGAITQDLRNASLYYWLGRCYFEVRDFKRSISTWERAVELDSARSDYHDWLGRAYGRKAEEESHSNTAGALSLARKTRHEFETAVHLDITNVNAQRDLISFKAGAPPSLGGGEGQTLEQVRALSAVDPVEGTLALADLYAGRKKFDQAGAEYQKILDSATAKVDAYLEVADYCRDRGDAEHFRKAVEAAVKIAPSDRRLSYYKGVALVLEKKDPSTAENSLRTYLAKVPDNSEVPAHASAYEWLGRLDENEQKSDLAIQQYQMALTLDPQNKAVQEALRRLQKK